VETVAELGPPPLPDDRPWLKEEGPRCSPATERSAESGACEREPSDMGTSALPIGTEPPDGTGITSN